MSEDVLLNKIIVDYPTEATDFPYQMTVFVTKVADGSPGISIATNTGATAEPADFFGNMMTDEDWGVVN